MERGNDSRKRKAGRLKEEYSFKRIYVRILGSNNLEKFTKLAPLLFQP
jgi:hypothetical protein